MALTPSRWIATFAVGACAISAAVIGVRASETDRFFYYYRDSYGMRVEDRARSLANAVAMLERRDSLAAAWRKGARSPDFELSFGSRVSAEQRHVLDSVGRAFWREQVHGPARVRMVLMVTTDSASAYRGIRVDRSQFHLLLPAQTDGRTCAMLLPMEPRLAATAATPFARANSLRGILEGYAGPCVWLAKYGLPGSAFGGWMSERDYVPASSVLERSPGVLLHAERAHSTAGAVAAEGFSNSIGIAAAGCLAGKASQCDSTWTLGDFGARSGMLPRGFLRGYRWWGESGSTGVLARHFVARLEVELGPEKFARLWSSNASLDRAFSEVAGASLGDVTRRMMLVDYGKLTATPWPTAFEWALDLGLIALSLSFLFVVTRRWRAVSA